MTAKGKKTITLQQGTAAYRIQTKLRKLLSFENIKEWETELKRRGAAHKCFYHYTKLGNLKCILQNSSWKMTKADCSNDPSEYPVHNASFTYSSLSSMGMWSQYTHWGLGVKKKTDEIGVRICIPKDVLKKIFKADNLYLETGSGPDRPLKSPKKFGLSDVAYWYFGGKEDGANDMLFYRDFTLPFKALGSYDRKTLEKRRRRAVWTRPDPDSPISPCIKRAIWRRECECRAYCDYTNQPDIPEAVFVKIAPELFHEMKFILEPGLRYEPEIGRCTGTDGSYDLKAFFEQELKEGKISLGQFIALPRTEYWEKNGA